MGIYCKSSRNSHSILFISQIITILFIFLSSTTTNSISFDFPNFASNDHRIILQGDSIRNGSLIEVTRNNASLYINRTGSVGRAIYSEAIQLWNATTGRQTDFETHFSFIIDGKNQTYAADALSFFLAPFGSALPPNSWGHGLGLLTRDIAQKNFATNQIVAVEFDSYENLWDLSSDHVGINVNSVVSVATKSLANGSIRDGRKANAWVTYNSSTKNLSVFLTYADNPAFNGNSTLFYIVDLSKVLPEWITVGFAAATGIYYELHQVLSWKFNSTSELVVDKKTGGEGQTNSNEGNDNIAQIDRDGKGNKTGMVVGIGVGLSVLACVLGFALFIWWKKRRGSRNILGDAAKGNLSINDSANADLSMDDAFEKGTGPKRFSYSELVYATNNFDKGGKLGQGGFGGVYKGFLSDLSLNVAVKRVSSGSQQGKKEYQTEVKIISQLRHRNLVQLIGWCHQGNELLLVYEFMPNRSLDKHLFGGENVLNWEVRYKIALGLASALLYLHEEWEQCVLHRDIKSSNIMLDSNFNAKLGDFGLARLVDHDVTSQITVLAGTMGYLAPECATGKSSKESDIYSFGIVALEIACGRKPVEVIRGDVLVDWVWKLYESGNIVEAADERLNMEFDEKQMERLLLVGLWCAQVDSSLRPSATQVINVLKFESALTMLPLKSPTPVYLPTA